MSGRSSYFGQSAAWLDLQKPEGERLHPLPAGVLNVDKVFPISV